MGSYGGLLRFDGSEFHNFSTEGAIATPAIRCIVQAPDGTLLAGSAGSGIYALAQDGSIFDLYERDGKLWLLQDSGIYALDKARILAGETPHATQYGTARGLTGSLRVNTCNYMAPDGSLYLTTRNGVSVFDFREISAPMPPLVINSIRVDDRTYESPEQLTPGA